MLRSVIGWVRHPDKNWSDTMRRMGQRLSAALASFPVKPWSEQLAGRKFEIAAKFARDKHSWPARATQWSPEKEPECVLYFSPHRTVGRPRRKWDDDLKNFTLVHFREHASWIDAAAGSTWMSKKRQFVHEFEQF